MQLRTAWHSLVARPQALLVASFAGAILIGAALLSLPFSTTRPIAPVDALFTSTSGVCVTGLSVADLGRDFTRAGQATLLALIQAGGIGIMTFTVLFFALIRHRVSLRAQFAVEDSFFQANAAREVRGFVPRIMAFTFLVEVTGGALLFLGFSARESAGDAAFLALFHAVSAFCNAGFSPYGDSLEGWRAAPMVVWPIAALIICGDLGYPAIFEVKERIAARLRGRRPARARLSTNTRIVLQVSLILTIAGALLICLFGTGPQGRRSASDALFQSITARTAGFNTVPLGAMPAASLLVIIGLMFIGGSPGSCAGGVKTTTFAVTVAWVWTRLRGRSDVAFGGCRISESLLGRAALLVGVSAIWIAAGTMVLAFLEPRFAPHELFFEVVSAFGTVGLSCGMTPHLSSASKLLLIATMFFGRLGPLTIALWVLEGERPKVRYPEAHIMVG